MRQVAAALHKFVPTEQTELRVAFGDHLDCLPPTCSMETEIARFRRWLADRGVDYDES